MVKSLERINNGGVVYFRSSEIATPHGFSTRLGGVSKQPHLAEMNFGKTLGDDPKNVEENYARIADAIGFSKESIVFTNQIHSNIVLPVGKEDVGKTFDCDGFVTREKGVTLAVRSADCVPILFCDEKASVIGAVHAGWRGTASRIQQNCVKEMCRLGAEAENITALIGACIHKCCYKVGRDFQKALQELLGEELTGRHLSEDMYADLVGLNTELLRESGVKKIIASEDCTCCNPEFYFSHRATKGKRGVMSAFISL